MLIHGEGVINSLINKLPVELHLPGYNFCGPGTKLEKRLKRGDQGINPLDSSCREHDIAYHLHKDLKLRHQADQVLEEAAWNRVKSRDAGIGEKAAAWAVTTAMKFKRKLGSGSKMLTTTTPPTVKTHKKNKSRRRRSGSRRQTISFRGGFLKKIVNAIKDRRSSVISGDNVDGADGAKLINVALKAAKRIIKNGGGKKRFRIPRVIPLPKEGGVLPLIPIFAGLSALGGLAGGISNIVKSVNEAKATKKQHEEGIRHNKMMEAIAMGKSGKALYLKPYKTGSALYLKPPPYSKN